MGVGNGHVVAAGRDGEVSLRIEGDDVGIAR